jgi:hypothetical protein
MGRFAVVILLPDDPADPSRMDFISREFDSWREVPDFMSEVEEREPKWRVVSFCHVEDLPLLMEPSDFIGGPPAESTAATEPNPGPATGDEPPRSDPPSTPDQP